MASLVFFINIEIAFWKDSFCISLYPYKLLCFSWFTWSKKIFKLALCLCKTIILCRKLLGPLKHKSLFLCSRPAQSLLLVWCDLSWKWVLCNWIKVLAYLAPIMCYYIVRFYTFLLIDLICLLDCRALICWHFILWDSNQMILSYNIHSICCQVIDWLSISFFILM